MGRWRKWRGGPAVRAHGGGHGREVGGGARHHGDGRGPQEAATRWPPPPLPTTRSVSAAASSASADRAGKLRFLPPPPGPSPPATLTRSSREKRTAVHAMRAAVHADRPTARPHPAPACAQRAISRRSDIRRRAVGEEAPVAGRSAMLAARGGLPAAAPRALATAVGRRVPVTPAARCMPHPSPVAPIRERGR